MSEEMNMEVVEDVVEAASEVSDVVDGEVTDSEVIEDDVVEAKNENLITDADAIEQALEAVIFAAPKAISQLKIRNLLNKMNYDTSNLAAYLESLIQKFENRGFQLIKVGGGFQFRTHPGQTDIVSKLVEEKPMRLGASALEVLSIVAYKQPITRAEVDVVRGVDSGHLLKGLLEKNLVRTAGHGESAGRPILYTTSSYFLEVFSLNDLADLPSLEEFQRELITNDGQEGSDSSVLAGLSPLAAEPDRGSFDDVSDAEVLMPDFGEALDSEEQQADLAKN